MYIVGGRIKTMAGKEIPEGVIHITDGKIAQIGRKGEAFRLNFLLFLKIVDFQ